METARELSTLLLFPSPPVVRMRMPFALALFLQVVMSMYWLAALAVVLLWDIMILIVMAFFAIASAVHGQPVEPSRNGQADSAQTSPIGAPHH